MLLLGIELPIEDEIRIIAHLDALKELLPGDLEDEACMRHARGCGESRT